MQNVVRLMHFKMTFNYHIYSIQVHLALTYTDMLKWIKTYLNMEVGTKIKIHYENTSI